MEHIINGRVLLENGADPNGGEPPGILVNNALFNGQRAMVELLRTAGARGASELVYAIAAKEDAKIEGIVAAASDFQKDPAFWKGVLVCAARLGDVKTVRTGEACGAPAPGAISWERIAKGVAEYCLSRLEACRKFLRRSHPHWALSGAETSHRGCIDHL